MMPAISASIDASWSERYIESVDFIRNNHKSFDPVIQFRVQGAADMVRRILFVSRHKRCCTTNTTQA